MHLNEYASAISETARGISFDHGPLMESVDQMVAILEGLIPGTTSPEAAESLGQFVGEFKKQRDQFLDIFPREMEEMRQSIVKTADEAADDLRELQRIHDQGIEDLRQLEEEQALRRKEPPKPPPIPASIEPVAAKAPDFSPGDILLESLLGLGKPGAQPNQTVRTSGNIWENWKKAGE